MNDPNGGAGRLVVQQKYDRDRVIEEAADLARGHKGVLAIEAGPATGADLAEKIRQLKREEAKFTSFPELIRLDQQALTDRGFTPDYRVQQLLQTSDFYAVTFAVTLRPALDWQFDRLDCQVEFHGDAQPKDQPVAFGVFPDNEWDVLARAQMQLDVGIDENLRFVCKTLDPKPDLAAQVEGRVKAAVNFVVPPRSYVLKRAKIQRWGRDDSKVYWRLLDAEFLADEPRLAVILRIPRGVRPIQALGVLAAYHTAKIWSADLRNLVKDFPSRIRSVFEGGLPLYDQGEWTLIEG